MKDLRQPMNDGQLRLVEDLYKEPIVMEYNCGLAECKGHQFFIERLKRKSFS